MLAIYTHMCRINRYLEPFCNPKFRLSRSFLKVALEATKTTRSNSTHSSSILHQVLTTLLSAMSSSPRPNVFDYLINSGQRPPIASMISPGDHHTSSRHQLETGKQLDAQRADPRRRLLSPQHTPEPSPLVESRINRCVITPKSPASTSIHHGGRDHLPGPGIFDDRPAGGDGSRTSTAAAAFGNGDIQVRADTSSSSRYAATCRHAGCLPRNAEEGAYRMLHSQYVHRREPADSEFWGPRLMVGGIYTPELGKTRGKKRRNKKREVEGGGGGCRCAIM